MIPAPQLLKLISRPLLCFLVGAAVGLAWSWVKPAADVMAIAIAEQSAQDRIPGQHWLLHAAAGSAIPSGGQLASGFSGKSQAITWLVILRGGVIVSALLASAPLFLASWFTGAAEAARRHRQAAAPSILSSQISLSGLCTTILLLGLLIAAPVHVPSFLLVIVLIALAVLGIGAMRSTMPATF